MTDGPFEVVYTTWGTITWLPDIRAWAKVVASLLAPGGMLYMADHHPILTTLEQEAGELVFRYPWRVVTAKNRSSSTRVRPIRAMPRSWKNSRSFEWAHPFSSLIGALMEAGLRLTQLREHERLPWQAFPIMVRTEGRGMYRLPEGHSGLPLAFSLRAVRD